MYTEKDVNNMKCFVFRIAQRTWGKSPKELSKVYDALFDYDGTGLWKEISLYLLNFYEECQNS